MSVTKTISEHFKVIGNSSDNIIVIENFIDVNSLIKLNQYLDNISGSEESFYGPLYLRFERIEKENSEVASIIKKYEEKIFDQIIYNFINKYNVPIKKNPSNYYHFVKWLPGMLSKLHSDCEKPNGGSTNYFNFDELNISVLVYINDGYSGGSIIFPNQQIFLKPSSGDLIIFPSNNSYKYEITRVQNNKKYVMRSWYSFDTEKIN